MASTSDLLHLPDGPVTLLGLGPLSPQWSAGDPTRTSILAAALGASVAVFAYLYYRADAAYHRERRALIAARVGSTRLIDNLPLTIGRPGGTP